MRYSQSGRSKVAAHWAGAAALLLIVVSCERPADVESPKDYSKGGISFQLPGNWKVTEDVTEPGEREFRYIFVESRGSALVVIQRYRPAVDYSTEAFAEEFIRSAMEETENMATLGPLKPVKSNVGAAAPIRAVVAGEERDGVEQTFSVTVLGEHVPHKARAFKVEQDDSVVFIVSQVSIEDWALVAPGFELITASLEVE